MDAQLQRNIKEIGKSADSVACIRIGVFVHAKIGNFEFNVNSDNIDLIYVAVGELFCLSLHGNSYDDLIQSKYR